MTLFTTTRKLILKIVKMPKPMRMVWGSLVAYWLADIINHAFVAIAVMIALFIPILINEYFFPASAANHQSNRSAAD
jgi:uncharacterized ion transporter superfamily protein YfcC